MLICHLIRVKVRQISSAVDKLDKMSWDDVRKEMVEDKGLEPAVADAIRQYVELKSGADLDAFITQLEALPEFVANQRVKEGLMEMRVLARYLKAFGVDGYISFDLSLARGLDYYTGVIYEAVVTSSDARGIGSVASGGRYDNLVGMFSGGLLFFEYLWII
jgi:histidyl-tRNA synthetase